MIRGALAQISSRQSYIDEIECFSDTDDTPFDLTGATAQVAIAIQDPWPVRSGWGQFYDFFPASGFRLIAGVAIVGVGVIQFTFTAAQIATLCPGQYVLGANLSRGGEAVQLVLGTLSVVDGVVPQ